MGSSNSPWLSNLRGSLLAFGDQGRVLAGHHSLLEVFTSGPKDVGLLEQIESRHGEHLRGGDGSFLSDGRADAGDVLPTVAGGVGGETRNAQAAGGDVPTDVTDVGRAFVRFV